MQLRPFFLSVCPRGEYQFSSAKGRVDLFVVTLLPPPGHTVGPNCEKQRVMRLQRWVCLCGWLNEIESFVCCATWIEYELAHHGQAPVAGSTAGTGRADPKPTSEMVALPDESPGHDRPEATPRPLETSSGTAGTQGAADAAEEQPAQENSAAKAAGSSESAPQAESPGVASVRKKVKSTKEPKAMAPRKGKEEVKEPQESSRAPHSSRPPHRRRSAPTRTPRATSEPPQTAQSRSALSDGAVARTPRSLGDPRLPKLLTDIESHFRRVERKLPLDASGWLRETAQLELFEEELQWILQQHEPPPEEATPDASPDASPSDAPKFVDGGKTPGEEATEAGEASPSAPTEGVDLETALLHLRHCEREHAYLQQMLGYDDVIFREERLAEIKQVEEEIDYEQRRVRHMETEHRKRERNLARVAARAVSMSVNDGDGNLRAMRHAEQFESESAVWQVKNESMQKQVLQLNIYLKQDMEKLEQLNSKLAALREKLETDEAKQWIEEQRLREEERWNEEQALGAEVRALQDRRTFEEQACKRSHISQLKQLAELRKKQTVMEPRLAQLEATEKQLRRQLKQLRKKRRDSRGEEGGLATAGTAAASTDGPKADGTLPGQPEATETEDESSATATTRTVAESLAQHAFQQQQAQQTQQQPPEGADGTAHDGTAADETKKAEKAESTVAAQDEQGATTNKAQVAQTLAQYVLPDKDQADSTSMAPPPKEHGGNVEDSAKMSAVVVEEIGPEQPARADQESRMVGVTA
eukprot:s1100_g11.t4